MKKATLETTAAVWSTDQQRQVLQK